MKHCCKNCEALDYYDGYWCRQGVALEWIPDIENGRCELFEEREGKFWLYEGSEF